MALNATETITKSEQDALESSGLKGKGFFLPGVPLGVKKQIDALQEKVMIGSKHLDALEVKDHRQIKAYEDAAEAQLKRLHQMEELLDSYALNHAGAGLFAQVQEQLAAFYRGHGQAISILNQSFEKNGQLTTVGREHLQPKVNETTDLKKAALSIGFSGVFPKTPIVDAAFNAERRAMLWAKYASMGAALGGLIAANLHFEYADWLNPENAQLAFRDVIRYGNLALEQGAAHLAKPLLGTALSVGETEWTDAAKLVLARPILSLLWSCKKRNGVQRASSKVGKRGCRPLCRARQARSSRPLANGHARLRPCPRTLDGPLRRKIP